MRPRAVNPGPWDSAPTNGWLPWPSGATGRWHEMGRPADDVYSSLKDDIERGVLTPGEHLVEDTIGSQFNVSRTPIRNAIKRLQADGLVTIEPRRGAFVASWTNDDAAEVMSIRSMLEPHAAALAAQRRTL